MFKNRQNSKENSSALSDNKIWEFVNLRLKCYCTSTSIIQFVAKQPGYTVSTFGDLVWWWSSTCTMYYVYLNISVPIWPYMNNCKGGLPLVDCNSSQTAERSLFVMANVDFILMYIWWSCLTTEANHIDPGRGGRRDHPTVAQAPAKQYIKMCISCPEGFKLG